MHRVSILQGSSALKVRPEKFWLISIGCQDGLQDGCTLRKRRPNNKFLFKASVLDVPRYRPLRNGLREFVDGKVEFLPQGREEEAFDCRFSGNRLWRKNAPKVARRYQGGVPI